MKKNVILTTLTTLLFLALTPVVLYAQDAQLEKLRADLARRYFEPESHMKLAKYLHDKGNRLLAFYILESARRTRFEEEEFNASFRRYFWGDPFDNSREAEAALLKLYAQNPASFTTVFKLADIYISRNDWSNAQKYLEEALRLKPDDLLTVGALAEVFLRSDRDKKAEELFDAFVKKHPDSAAAWQRRIEAVTQTKPPEAKRLLAEAIKRFPDDARFPFRMGGLLAAEEKFREAEPYFAAAATLAKDSAHIQGWTGRFYLKSLNQPDKALPFYLNAYFLDPHFYETEYAEGRISNLNEDAAETRFDELVARKVSLESLLPDENPVVAGLAIEAMSERWEAKYVKPLVNAMAHDDPNVRAKAMEALKNHTDRSFDQELKKLLADPDLRRRGLALYIAVHHWKEEGLVEAKKCLTEEAQLLRFDAISALVLEGGDEGRRIALAHRESEKHPWLKKMLNTLKQK